jgi:subtilisin
MARASTAGRHEREIASPRTDGGARDENPVRRTSNSMDRCHEASYMEDRPMPTPKKRTSPPADVPPAEPEAAWESGALTGRYLVTYRDGAQTEALAHLEQSAGVHSFARASDFSAAAVDPAKIEQAEVMVFEEIGVAVVNAPPDAAVGIASAAGEPGSPILFVEPERIMSVLSDFEPALQPGDAADPGHPGLSGEGVVQVSLPYLRGYRDALANLYTQLAETDGAAAAGLGVLAFGDTALATWGLQATRVTSSTVSGRGVRVAVLDTGLDLRHPDFAGRSIVSASFITGQTVQDGHGHGTHCIGTACGPLRPTATRRYGVAHGSQIFAGKVLSNSGSGADAGILAGINWAVTNRCQVISMSLGAAAPPSPTYEQVAQRALAQGTLIVAAAGNESRRSQGLLRAVSRPANSPSILAVAALDSALAIADFSNRGTTTGGGQVDIAGPGVNVFSTWPMPTRYRAISGTSMATPHVAGIAALLVESRRATGSALWRLLQSGAQRLRLPSIDCGAGLVQAP